MTLVASLIWVGAGIYSATNKGVAADVDSVLLEPVNPKIDQETVELLSNRLKVEIAPPEPIVSSTSASINVIDSSMNNATESASIKEGELR